MNRIETNCIPFVDTVCDYTPIVSTITSIVSLFFKSFVLPFLSQEAIQNSHFYTHLQEKSFARCILLLVPILGNIVIGILDCLKCCENSENEPFNQELLDDAEDFLNGELQEKGLVDMIMGYAGYRLSDREKEDLAREEHYWSGTPVPQAELMRAHYREMEEREFQGIKDALGGNEAFEAIPILNIANKPLHFYYDLNPEELEFPTMRGIGHDGEPFISFKVYRAGQQIILTFFRVKDFPKIWLSAPYIHNNREAFLRRIARLDAAG